MGMCMPGMGPGGCVSMAGDGMVYIPIMAGHNMHNMMMFPPHYGVPMHMGGSATHTPVHMAVSAPMRVPVSVSGASHAAVAASPAPSAVDTMYVVPSPHTTLAGPQSVTPPPTLSDATLLMEMQRTP